MGLWGTMKKICKNCNKTFEVNRDRIIFCRKGCATQFRMVNGLAKKMGQLNKDRMLGIKLPLEVCEKIRLGHLGKKHSNSTLQKMSEAQRKRFGTYFREILSKKDKNFLRKTKEYKEWRNKIFQRDNYKCVSCGGKKPFEVDHYPISFAKILRKFNIKTLVEALRCKMLWNIKNGRVLCIPCHRFVTYKR